MICPLGFSPGALRWKEYRPLRGKLCPTRRFVSAREMPRQHRIQLTPIFLSANRTRLPSRAVRKRSAAPFFGSCPVRKTRLSLPQFPAFSCKNVASGMHGLAFPVKQYCPEINCWMFVDQRKLRSCKCSERIPRYSASMIIEIAFLLPHFIEVDPRNRGVRPNFLDFARNFLRGCSSV